LHRCRGLSNRRRGGVCALESDHVV